MAIKIAIRRTSSLALLLIYSASLGALHAQWTAKTATCPRSSAGTAVVGEDIYLIGGAGCVGTGGTMLDLVEAYDTKLDTWTTRAPLAVGRYGLSAVTVAGKIYAIGGIEVVGGVLVYSSAVEEYDPIGNTWTSKTAMPTPRAYFGLAAVGTDIYAIGGDDGSGPITTIEKYDTLFNTWAAILPVMPTARWGLTAATVNGKVYALGGRGQFGAVLTTVEEFTPVPAGWLTMTPMPVGQAFLSSVTDGCRIITAGKEGGVAAVQSFDPATNAWNAMPTLGLTPRFSMGLALVDNNQYVSPGYIDGRKLHAIGGTAGVSPTFDVGVNEVLCTANVKERNAASTPNIDTLSAICQPVSPSVFVVEVTHPAAPATASTLIIRSTITPVPNGVAAPLPLLGRLLCSGPKLATAFAGIDVIRPISVNQMNWFLPIPPGIYCLGFCAQAVTYGGGGGQLSSCLSGVVGP